MASEEPCSLLIIILDTNPVWWGQRLMKHDTEVVLSRCLDAILVFSNAHLMMKHGNMLGLIAAHTDSSKFIYPTANSDDGIFSTDASCDIAVGGKQQDGKYELFTKVNNTIIDELRELMLEEPLGGDVASDCLVAGAMATALCYIHKFEKDKKVSNISSRILIIKGSEDNPSQYMNFMNAVFTAQKQNVVVDACILDKESGLLQQACDITGGTYLEIPQPAGLLQYLLWVYLPDPSVRPRLSLPAKVQVDYRAACFCHRTLIDVGYVCSVCLSIFCTFSPICSTCQTTFKLQRPPKLMKRKVKKAAS